MSAALVDLESPPQVCDSKRNFPRDAAPGGAPVSVATARQGTRMVDCDHYQVWSTLQDEALRAHAAFIAAARGAALARHRGEEERAGSLTLLARKQHERWVRASQVMALYEY
jgi:hypothetical protein